MNAQPNYYAKVAALPCTGKPGVHIVKVEHDDWCAQLMNGEECNCDPDVWCSTCGYKTIMEHQQKVPQ